MYREIRAAVDLGPLDNRAGCLTKFGESTPRECVAGAAAATSTVVLFGDSHAAQWLPAMDAAAKQLDLRLVTMLKSACPATDVPSFSRKMRRVEHECDAWRVQALTRIVELRPALVLVASSVGYIESAARGRVGSYAQSSYDEWRPGTRRTLETLSASGGVTVLLHDTPTPGFDVAACLMRVARHGWVGAGVCDARRASALDTDAVRAEQMAADGLGDVRLLDLSDEFCDATICPAKLGGRIVYRDTNHLSVTFSLTMAPVLVQQALAPGPAATSRDWSRRVSRGWCSEVGSSAECPGPTVANCDATDIPPLSGHLRDLYRRVICEPDVRAGGLPAGVPPAAGPALVGRVAAGLTVELHRGSRLRGDLSTSSSVTSQWQQSTQHRAVPLARPRQLHAVSQRLGRRSRGELEVHQPLLEGDSHLLSHGRGHAARADTWTSS